MKNILKIDVHEPFGVEAVSDTFTTVELKKVARDIKRQKRRIQMHKVMAILGVSAIYEDTSGELTDSNLGPPLRKT